MKLVYHPASTTSRPIMLFAAETGLKLDMAVDDLFTGDHTQAKHAAANPNRLAAALEGGDFRLTVGRSR